MTELIDEVVCLYMYNEMGTFLNSVFLTIVYTIKKQEAIVRTLNQLLQWFSFCSLDTELNVTAGS